MGNCTQNPEIYRFCPGPANLSGQGWGKKIDFAKIGYHAVPLLLPQTPKSLPKLPGRIILKNLGNTVRTTVESQVFVIKKSIFLKLELGERRRFTSALGITTSANFAMITLVQTSFSVDSGLSFLCCIGNYQIEPRKFITTILGSMRSSIAASRTLHKSASLQA